MLGETWAVTAKHAAKRVGAPRNDLHARISPRDWTACLAALESGLADRLRALPSDAARERTLASLARALERSEGR
jgi:hypothetical protein